MSLKSPVVTTFGQYWLSFQKDKKVKVKERLINISHQSLLK